MSDDRGTGPGDGMNGDVDGDMIDRLDGKLSPARKVRLLTGATTWRTAAEPGIGLRQMVCSDGPAGMRGESGDERRTSALLPSASALGALWDEELLTELGTLLAAGAVRKGVDVVLAPTLDLPRSPLGGRHFECFSENPEPAWRTGAALIRGIKARGVARSRCGSGCATPGGAPAGRSSRSTWHVRDRSWSGRSAGSPGTPRSAPRRAGRWRRTWSYRPGPCGTGPRRTVPGARSRGRTASWSGARPETCGGRAR